MRIWDWREEIYELESEPTSYCIKSLEDLAGKVVLAKYFCKHLNLITL
jgi:hypothetical protein